MSGREFEVIVWGATGYTGRLVAAHLLKTYGAAGDLKWAMAGRSADKLAEVKAEIGAPASLPTIVADATDPASIDAMVRRADVVISTVGPYQLYGAPLVDGLREGGDRLRRPDRRIQLDRGDDGRASDDGPRVRGAAGVLLRLRLDPVRPRGLVRRGEPSRRASAPMRRGSAAGCATLKGGLSGGTLASGMATQAAVQRDPAVAALLADPFALTPGFDGAPQPDGDTPYDDTVAGSWVGPFMMAGINTKAVHRTNFLLGHPWGAGFQYDEMQMLAGPPAEAARAAWAASASARPACRSRAKGRPARSARRVLRHPGDRRGSGADASSARRSRATWTPATARPPRCWARAPSASPATFPRDRVPGGCWTSAAAMNGALIRRLEARAGLTFTVED